jgi:hypothetical protein
MPETRYTVRDEPEVVARIEADLRRVVERVTQGDPHLRSLVLTGGFGRGEGAVLAGQPQNDYDFVAFRRSGRPDDDYGEMRAELEAELGLHVDLAPVPLWRLPWVPRSIFWYETALRGRTLWGRELLERVPVREPGSIHRAEGLRLLVNRAAGLLLATLEPEEHLFRIQAAKGLLAAFDAHLLARGLFPPSQRERWAHVHALKEAPLPASSAMAWDWLDWAFRFKVDPERAPHRPGLAAWRSARRAILDAVPVALAHARLDSLESYAASDGWVDRMFYAQRAPAVPGAPRFHRHPTGAVRLATIRMLEDAEEAVVPLAAAERHMGRIVRLNGGHPLQVLAALRGATLQ